MAATAVAVAGRVVVVVADVFDKMCTGGDDGGAWIMNGSISVEGWRLRQETLRQGTSL